MRKKLHPTQRKILNILKRTIDNPLTIREIQEELNISSTSVVAHHISQLEPKGYLKRNPVNPRDYQVLQGSPEKLITFLNVYGLVKCGPNGSILDGNPEDKVPIASKLIPFPVNDAFLVKAKGDSMIPRICGGDLVIVRRTNYVNDGNIVVCVNNGEAMIKRFKREGNKVILISENAEKYPPFIASDDFRIEGEVRGVIKSNL